MKTFKLFIGIAVAVIILSSCTQSVCPTYAKQSDGSHLERTQCTDYSRKTY
jgi:hypothetical protein